MLITGYGTQCHTPNAQYKSPSKIRFDRFTYTVPKSYIPMFWFCDTSVWCGEEPILSKINCCQICDQ